MSMWRKAMVALGLQDDEDDADFLGYDTYEDTNYDAPARVPAREVADTREPARVTRPSAMPSMRTRDAPTVRTITPDEPVRPSTIRTMPMTAPTSPACTCVNQKVSTTRKKSVNVSR